MSMNKAIWLICFLITFKFSFAQDLYVPIEKENRIYNKTGSQCVWASLETVGRWIEEKKLYNITSRPECQSYANPDSVEVVLNKLQVGFIQTTNKEDGLLLIKKSMSQGYGCVFGARQVHAMSLIHFDESANRVHYIDNSNPKRNVETMSVSKFMNIWDGWVIVIVKEPNKKILDFLSNRKINMWYLKDE